MTPTRINNMTMTRIRKTDEYKAVMIDLALMGIIDKDFVEEWIGNTIPATLKPVVELDDESEDM